MRNAMFSIIVFLLCGCSTATLPPQYLSDRDAQEVFSLLKNAMYKKNFSRLDWTHWSFQTLHGTGEGFKVYLIPAKNNSKEMIIFTKPNAVAKYNWVVFDLKENGEKYSGTIIQRSIDNNRVLQTIEVTDNKWVKSGDKWRNEVISKAFTPSKAEPIFWVRLNYLLNNYEGLNDFIVMPEQVTGVKK